eukprot:416637_1
MNYQMNKFDPLRLGDGYDNEMNSRYNGQSHYTHSYIHSKMNDGDTQTVLYELGYMIHGSLNATGISDPLKNKRMHHFDHVVMEDICREYLDSFSSISSVENNGIIYFGAFGFESAKKC